MKRHLLLIPILVLTLTSLAWADLLSGSRSSAPGGGIWANDGWDGGNFSITWNISNVVGDLPWKYEYKIDAQGPPGAPSKYISHWIFEVSDVPNARYLFPDGLAVEGPKTWTPSSGNPDMPGNLFGIKFDELSGNPNNFVFYSTQPPMWGDFYGKNGRNPDEIGLEFVIAYNIGFGKEPTTSFTNWIAVPDTEGANGNGKIPEPTTMLLLGSGLLGLAGLRKKFKK